MDHVSITMKNLPLKQGRSSLVVVQVLRAFAALLVLLGHAQGRTIELAMAAGEKIPFVLVFPGGLGVDLFFCISGFIMVVSSDQIFEKPHAFSLFLFRRAIRLAPLYWMLTLAYALVLLLGSHGYGGNFFAALIASLVFLPYPTYGADGSNVYPLFSLGWTLNYEVFFYLVFSGFIFLPRRRAIFAIEIVLVVLVVIGLVFSPSEVAYRFWTQPIILEFGFGMMIGYVWLTGRSPSVPVCIVLAACAISLLVSDPMGLLSKGSESTQNNMQRVIGLGLPAAAILLAAVSVERYFSFNGKLFGLFAILGDASYSLYLIHPFILISLGKAWLWFGIKGPLGWIALETLFLISSCCAAVITYSCFEKPTTEWLKRKLSKRLLWSAYSARSP